ncbi:hypothetical protein DBR43_07830 [Pedobacter sp. KBW06]|uniref:recombinase family protein n=1 Tax=Pedobacter sp. KBW06 TaxID=2153359 RepID=UPI000F5B62FE|nr:recombinase family protein [Pedobacter sp. KBW06]RQO75260.1 hypothetical protein DBR43_07830 [Pedobacter sp. KBW06]
MATFGEIPTHLTWAFETIAEGVFATDVVWRMAKERGLKCQRNTFWDLIRNPIYCGKIVVPRDEHTEMYLADGKHKPIISESLFWDVQDVLNARKKAQQVKIETPENLPLRGFLYCPECLKTLTGSPSKGRTGHYYYYHCKSPCKSRFSALKINKDFEDGLMAFLPKPGMAELFKEVIMDATSNDTLNFEQERKRLVSEVSEQNNMLTKLRTMLLSDDIDLQDYKIMKTKCDEKITNLESKLKELKENASEISDMGQIIDEALEKLQILHDLYIEGDISDKRHVTGSIYDEKWTIFENKGRTGKINLAVQLIYQINTAFGHKKARVRTNSGLVPLAVLRSKRFKYDLIRISKILVRKELLEQILQKTEW